MKDYSNVAESGNVMHRRFCPNCGTALFSEAEIRPHLIFVRAGTLDDPEVAKPVADHLDVAGAHLGVLRSIAAPGRETAAAGAGWAGRPGVPRSVQ